MSTLSSSTASAGHFVPTRLPRSRGLQPPCYFKFEPGTSEAEIYKPWVSESWHADFVRTKVKIASIAMEMVARQAPDLRTSAPGATDLRLPVV